MISLETRAQIRRHFYAEHWKIGTIAGELGVHPDTVRHAIEAERFRSTQLLRPSIVDPYAEFIRQTLDQYPRLRATRIYQMVRDRGYAGSVVQLRRQVARLRPSIREPFLRLQTFPGEQGQIDWAHFGHVHAFQAWNGQPRAILYDNLKAAVLERRGSQILFNPRLLELSAHYHFAPQPCQALAGRDQVAHQRRWPGGDGQTVEQVFAEEQPRLLPPPLHPFSTDRIETVRSHKTIYVRFDLNDYSIPPEAVGRPLTLAASDTLVRILDGATEIARHQRTYDRHQPVLDPAHKEALLKLKRKAFHATPAGRLEQAVPESQTLLDLAFTQGESAGRQTAQLLKLLDQYGPTALRRAIVEALERNTPRASSVAFLLRRKPRPARLALDLSHHPEAQAVEVRPHDLEIYDELARTQDDDDSPK